LRIGVARARPPKVLFVGNEYKLMPEKIAFARSLHTALLISQLGSPDAHALYRDALGCGVVGIPNTGFDPSVFAPRRAWDEREVDLGYRAYASPLYLGHDERRELAACVREAAPRHGLTTDISLSPDARFDEHGWAAFLNRCRGQIGSEAGGDRFELTDETRMRVNAYLADHPEATAPEIRERFFTEPSVSGRALSGRVVEAAATKTVQILLEGEYGGFFEPDVHYLCLRKDFANLDDVLDRFRDRAASERIADAAFEVVSAELTYDRLVRRLHAAIEPLARG